MTEFEGCSLVIYNVFFDYYTGCVYSPSEKEAKEIIDICCASWVNGDIVCTIEGDYRDMNVSEICKKCRDFIEKQIRI